VLFGEYPYGTDVERRLVAVKFIRKKMSWQGREYLLGFGSLRLGCYLLTA
jgi:hypothetical protein